MEPLGVESHQYLVVLLAPAPITHQQASAAMDNLDVVVAAVVASISPLWLELVVQAALQAAAVEAAKLIWALPPAQVAMAVMATVVFTLGDGEA